MWKFAGAGRRLRALAAALLVLAPGCSQAGGFDGERAYRDLTDLVRIGPRPAGSTGSARARELIQQRLRQAGWPVEEHDLRVLVPGRGAVDMTNLVAVRPGRSPALVLIGTHYDTKQLDGRFVGANDGASGVALLLELARVLGDEPRPLTVWLVFFDGEESFGASITANDGLFGSRALVAQMHDRDELERITAFVLVDMVGDRDLNLTPDVTSSPRLRAYVREEAQRLGLSSRIDTEAALHLIDDHTPFLEAGVEPVVALIDFQFGARRTPGPLWHTAEDDLGAVSAESLNSVGRLVVELLKRIEREASAPTGAQTPGSTYPAAPHGPQSREPAARAGGGPASGAP